MLLAAIVSVAKAAELAIPWANCIDKDIQYRKDHPEYDPDDDDFWPPLDRKDDGEDEE